MKLDRTVILPTDDAALAQGLFNHLIDDEDCLVVVVIGDDDLARRVVRLADARARAVIAGFERKVLWARDAALVMEEIQRLKEGKAKLPSTWAKTVIAFSVSLADAVMDVIKRKDPSINFVRLERAFANAGVSQ